jgi:hypothetical protein
VVRFKTQGGKMMHYEKYVVAITDKNGKSYREFDSERLMLGRKSKVYLPFDSEYKILIKNNSEARIKLNIDIDGTSVSGSGGLIMSAYSTESLERFVDVARKFLFVRKNDDRVSDPSSGENGILKILIEKEYTPSYTYTGQPVWIQQSPSVPVKEYDNSVWISSSLRGMNSTLLAATSDSHCDSAPCSMTYSCNMAQTRQLLNEEAGATVEGGTSSQQFGTTYWRGTDGMPFEFIFKLLGQQGVSDETRIEYEKYLQLKKKFEGT